MSVSSVPRKPTPVASVDCGRHEEDDRGYGWIVFAGVLLLLGTLNFIHGIAAIGNTNFFVHVEMGHAAVSHAREATKAPRWLS